MKRIGILGCGAIGTQIAIAIDSGIIKAELTHVFDNDATKSKGLISKLKQKPFILEEKKIVIYPRKVAYKQELIGASKWFRKKRKLKKMKKEEIVKIREQLKEYKNFELWSFAETL